MEERGALARFRYRLPSLAFAVRQGAVSDPDDAGAFGSDDDDEAGNKSIEEEEEDDEELEEQEEEELGGHGKFLADRTDTDMGVDK
jgi:hypothetical protein